MSAAVEPGRDAGGLGMLEIVDVAPRDGLQNAPRSLSPGLRAELCERLFAAGVRRMEAVSFVDPRRVAQMGGAEEVVAALSSAVLDAAEGLVLNERGLERLLGTGLRRARIAVAVSDPFKSAQRRDVGRRRPGRGDPHGRPGARE